jgi:branched-chain amino acid transport system substrate-binding protein
MSAVGNWGAKGQDELIKRMKTQYNEPWMTQNAISTYGDMWILKTALEKAGKADRESVASAIRGLNEGPSPYFPGGELKFDEVGHRVGATLTVIQWQNGVPVTVFPEANAVAKPLWPGK